MKSLLLWLAMPLLSDCQTLEESWFIKKDVNKAIIENAKYQDVDTTNAATHYVIGKWNVYVNYICYLMVIIGTQGLKLIERWLIDLMR